MRQLTEEEKKLEQEALKYFNGTNRRYMWEYIDGNDELVIGAEVKREDVPVVDGVVADLYQNMSPKEIEDAQRNIIDSHMEHYTNYKGVGINS